MEYNNFKNNKQEEYYKRTKSFLLSNKKILINPGGMGLGKTWATCKSFKESSINFSFITVPTAPTKNIWSEEFNRLGLNGQYAVWFSKNSCCIKKIKNPKFDINKECKDDCEYWKNIQKNGNYTLDAEEELLKLDNYLPTFPKAYYKKKGCKNCLMPVCRYGLKKRKYLIGDYFGFLNKEMFDSIINSKEELNKLKSQGILVIDESHLVPERAKDFLSKTINFTKTIEQLEEEINCDYINLKPLIKYKWYQTIKKLKDINDYIINKSSSKEGRYNYNDFYDDYNFIHQTDSFNFKEFRSALKDLIKEGYKINPEEFYNEEDFFCLKLYKFLNIWETKLHDPTYKHYFQYKNIIKKNLRFIIDCFDTSKYLYDIFRGWSQIILNSGTIPDYEYFERQTGINKFGDLVKYEKLIESYSIKENIIIYPHGNFISRNRENTYKNNNILLNEILKKIEGRTIIYIQNKGISRLLKSQIKNKKVIDFCSKDDGFSTNQEDWLILEKEFNSTKECIAIMNINGRVEGFNFLDEETEQPVNNIIIYGYPFPKIGLSYDDQKAYYSSFIKDEKIVTKWINYTPVLIRIHQAVCRAKRKEDDNPIIILWDNQFGNKKLAYNYMPDDLKGKICWDSDSLFLEISKIKQRGKSNGFNI